LPADLRPIVQDNRFFDDPGLVVFEHACKLGCEGHRQAARLALTWPR
jgi:hypothetical protein